MPSRPAQNPQPAAPAAQNASRWRLLWWVLGVLAVLVQLYGLYAPQQPGADSGLALPHADKVAHLLMFAAPVALLIPAGLRPGLVVGVFAAHAVISEVIQGLFLSHRAGDPWDVAADLTGVALGVLCGLALRRLGARCRTA